MTQFFQIEQISPLSLKRVPEAKEKEFKALIIYLPHRALHNVEKESLEKDSCPSLTHFLTYQLRLAKLNV